MSTHVTHTTRITHDDSRRPPIEAATRTPQHPDLSSWSACALQALAHASAMGLLIPLSALYSAHERQHGR